MSDATRSSPFIVTKEHHRFAEFCDACSRHRYIGLCYGPPGVGKTLSARHYAKWDTFEATMTAVCSPGAGRPISEDILGCNTVFYTPSVVNSPSRVERRLGELRKLLTGLLHQARDRYNVSTPEDDTVKEFTRLIIVDEADRLNVLSLEQLREIYDGGQVGLILIGIPGIEKRLSRYAQFYSRVGFVHRFRTLSGNELRSIIAQSGQELGLTADEMASTDEEAMATLIRITGGNFRLIQRLFSQIARVLEINELRRVTKEVVEVARESLVIGATV